MTDQPAPIQPASSRAARFAKYKAPLPATSVAPPLDKQLAALREAIPAECVRLDNAVDMGRVHPAAAQARKHALRHALANFERWQAAQAQPESQP